MDIPEAAATAPDSAAMVHRCDTVIIGSGFAGLLAAIRLKARGLHDFVLLERNPELGGTWQVNTYPGAEVDVPTCLYSVSFAPYPFSKTYAPQSELLAYTGEYPLDLLQFADVARHCCGLAAASDDGFGNVLAALELAAGDDHMCTLLRQQVCNRFANASAGPGNKSDLALKVEQVGLRHAAGPLLS